MALYPYHVQLFPKTSPTRARPRQELCSRIPKLSANCTLHGSFSLLGGSDWQTPMGATAHPVCHKDSFLHLFSESSFSTIFVNLSFQEGQTTISITMFGFWATRGPLSFPAIHLKFPLPLVFTLQILIAYPTQLLKVLVAYPTREPQLLIVAYPNPHC